MSALEGKTAFVAGGTSGIGLAVAAAFAAAGGRVTIAGRRPDGPEIARDAGCGFASLDVADETSVVAALDQADVRLGAIDVLVLNAGVAQPPTSLQGLETEAARAVVDTTCSASSGASSTARRGWPTAARSSSRPRSRP